MLYLIAPLKVTTVSANESAAYPASNLNLDYPSMVYRSGNLTSIQATYQTDGSPFNTVSIYGTNLRPGDTWRVRTAATAAATTSAPTYDSGTLAAFSGTVNTQQNMTLLALPTTRTDTFVRVDIVSTGNPSGYVEAERLIIGKRIEEEGMDWGADQNFEDPSELNVYRGFTSVDPFATKVSWKFQVSGVAEASYMNNWFPFLRDNGTKKGVLLIPDHLSPHLQNEALFGRVTGVAKGQAVSSNEYKLDLAITEI